MVSGMWQICNEKEPWFLIYPVGECWLHWETGCEPLVTCWHRPVTCWILDPSPGNLILNPKAFSWPPVGSLQPLPLGSHPVLFGKEPGDPGQVVPPAATGV